MDNNMIGHSIQVVSQWWQKACMAKNLAELDKAAQAGYMVAKGLSADEYNPIAVHLVNDLVNELNCRLDPEFSKKYKEKFK